MVGPRLPVERLEATAVEGTGATLGLVPSVGAPPRPSPPSHPPHGLPVPYFPAWWPQWLPALWEGLCTPALSIFHAATR